MKLYSRPLSPYSSIVRCVAYLKDVPLKIIASPAEVPAPEDFGWKAPTGRIPVLITGSGETIVESAVIVEYLEERFPEPALLPADPRDRARVRMFTRIADLDVLVPMTRLLRMHAAPQRDHTSIEDEFAKLHNGLQTIEGRMADGPYALGSQVSLADGWLTPIRFMLNHLRESTGRADLLAEHPKVEAYQHIVAQQPSLLRVWNEMTDGLKVSVSQLGMEAQA